MSTPDGVQTLAEALACLLWHADSVAEIDVDMPKLGTVMVTSLMGEAAKFLVEIKVDEENIVGYWVTVEPQ